MTFLLEYDVWPARSLVLSLLIISAVLVVLRMALPQRMRIAYHAVQPFVLLPVLAYAAGWAALHIQDGDHWRAVASICLGLALPFFYSYPLLNFDALSETLDDSRVAQFLSNARTSA